MHDNQEEIMFDISEVAAMAEMIAVFVVKGITYKVVRENGSPVFFRLIVTGGF